MIQIRQRFTFRMNEPDRQRYGGDEWSTYNDEALLDLPFGDVVTIEDTIDMTMLRLRLRIASGQVGARELRAMLWLARGRTDPWATFTPNVQRLDISFEGTEDDASPPALTGTTSGNAEAAPS